MANAAEGRTLASGSSSSVDQERESLRVADAADGERGAGADDGIGEGDAAAEHGVIPLPGVLGGEDGGQGFDAGAVLRASGGGATTIAKQSQDARARARRAA